VSDAEVYRVKIGATIYVLMGLVILLGIMILFFAGNGSKSASESIALYSFALIFTVLLPIASLAGTYLKIKVTMEENSLTVEGLLKKTEIRYSSVVRVRETKEFPSPLDRCSYEATTSLHRIEITYKGKNGRENTECVCPGKMQEFLSKLEAKLQDPGIIIKEKAESK